MKKIITSLLLIYSILLLTACPSKEKTFRTARESSAKMSVYGKKIIEANIAAYKAEEISPEAFRDLTKTTRRFVEGVKIYRAALERTESAFKTNDNQNSRITLSDLSVLFDERVASVFLDLANRLELVKGSQSELIKSLIASVRLTILAVQGAFSEANIAINASVAKINFIGEEHFV